VKKHTPVVLSAAEREAALHGKRPMVAAAEASTTGPSSEPLDPELMAASFSDAYQGLEILRVKRRTQRRGAETRREEREARGVPWLAMSKKLRAAGVRARTTRAHRIRRAFDDRTPEAPTYRQIHDYLADHGE